MTPHRSETEPFELQAGRAPAPARAAALALLLLGSPWGAAAAIERRPTLVPGIDLILSCTQTSPADPNVFSDGDTVTLQCVVTNDGTNPSGQQTSIVAVLSADAIVDSSDSVIAFNKTIPSLASGASANVTLSANHQFTIPGPRKLCTKIDVIVEALDTQAGRIQEADEANNVVCTDLTVLNPRKDLIPVPGSVTVTPDPRDPNALRAGLQLQVAYSSLNQGNGAIRSSYSNSIRIGTTADSALADPNSQICIKTLLGGPNPFQQGGASVSVSHGFGVEDPNILDTCKIPFGLPEGPYLLVIQVDALGTIVEQTPSGTVGPAESNNVLATPIAIQKPVAPQIGIQHDPNRPGDQRVEIFGPGTEEMIVRVASARDLAGYSFRLSWSPPGLLSLGDPALPGGDPSQVEFSGFLESGGRSQTCSVTGIDPAAGHLDVACTTSDPGGGAGAVTEIPVPLATITWTAAAPGEGTFTLSSFTAEDSSGAAFTGLRVLGGTFIVDGVGEIAVLDATHPAEAYPGVPFDTSWDFRNEGFGPAAPPVITALILSRDAVYDDPNSPLPDVQACFASEPLPVPPLTTVHKAIPGCRLTQNVRPGIYSAFFMPLSGGDPGSRVTGEIAYPSRVVALRKSGKGNVAEVTAAPDQIGGTTGVTLSSERKFRGKAITSVKSIRRDRNWLVRLARTGRGRRLLEVVNVPVGPTAAPGVLTKLRLPKEARELLGAADVDGDGEDELILLTETRKDGIRLDFRRIDSTQRKPEICVSAARTDALPGKVVAATGIQYDGDPADELAVLTDDGVLTIHDLALTGSPPPPFPCRPTPVILKEDRAVAELTPIAGGTALGGPGDRVFGLCALDWQLDQVEEIGALVENAAGIQSLRIFDAPAAPGAAAVLLADDPDFTGAGGGARARSIACTR